MEVGATAWGQVLNKLVKAITSWNRDAEHFPTDRDHLDLCIALGPRVAGLEGPGVWQPRC